MPPEAKVFTVSHNPLYRQNIRGWVEVFDEHRVVLEAGNYMEVVKSIPVAMERGVEIAIIDGRMDAEWDGRVHNRFMNSKQIARVIGEQLPGVKIISLSPSEENPGFGHVHRDSRQSASVTLLADTITNM
ncbi:MAG: hypothetical protein HY430_00575 [Candidatus Levybacteria bacterium]|nr:hypothetical protein [Candidatus Levybacteria bacterium]